MYTYKQTYMHAYIHTQPQLETQAQPETTEGEAVEPAEADRGSFMGTKNFVPGTYATTHIVTLHIMTLYLIFY